MGGVKQLIVAELQLSDFVQLSAMCLQAFRGHSASENSKIPACLGELSPVEVRALHTELAMDAPPVSAWPCTSARNNAVAWGWLCSHTNMLPELPSNYLCLPLSELHRSGCWNDMLGYSSFSYNKRFLSLEELLVGW